MPELPRLSVNVNKIALLRNSRHTGVPDLLQFAALAREAGADGITVHPRPDERHIRRDDVLRLSEWMTPWRPNFELNLEGFPDERLIEIVRAVRPEQCTLVPDSPTAVTSDKGWSLDDTTVDNLRAAISAVKGLDSRVILFADPDPSVVPGLRELGVDGIEIYTGAYAAEFRHGTVGVHFHGTIAAARRAIKLGLRVNIGHDLNLENLPGLMAAMPTVAEASIGHELMADALRMGFSAAVRAYRNKLQGRSSPTSP